MSVIDYVIEDYLQYGINVAEAKYYPAKDRQFHPNFKVRPLTSKFYARHEGCDSPDMYQDMLVKQSKWLSQNKDGEAETTNQEYGLYTKTLVEQDKGNRALYYGRTISKESKLEEIIRKATRIGV